MHLTDIAKDCCDVLAISKKGADILLEERRRLQQLPTITSPPQLVPKLFCYGGVGTYHCIYCTQPISSNVPHIRKLYFIPAYFVCVCSACLTIVTS